MKAIGRTQDVVIFFHNELELFEAVKVLLDYNKSIRISFFLFLGYIVLSRQVIV